MRDVAQKVTHLYISLILFSTLSTLQEEETTSLTIEKEVNQRGLAGILLYKNKLYHDTTIM